MSNQIVADKQGLSWRFWLRSGFAKWDDVSDYYLSKLKEFPFFTVVVKNTKLNFNQLWINADPLAHKIACHAKNAAAKQWQVIHAGSQNVDEQVFAYSGRVLMRTLALLLTLASGWAIACFFTVREELGNIRSDVYHNASLENTELVLLLLLLIAPWIVFCLHLGPRCIELLRRSKQSISVDPEKNFLFRRESEEFYPLG